MFTHLRGAVAFPAAPGFAAVGALATTAIDIRLVAVLDAVATRGLARRRCCFAPTAHTQAALGAVPGNTAHSGNASCTRGAAAVDVRFAAVQNIVKAARGLTPAVVATSGRAVLVREALARS